MYGLERFNLSKCFGIVLLVRKRIVTGGIVLIFLGGLVDVERRYVCIFFNDFVVILVLI